MKDPYEVLGVSRNASDSEIKKAYHELVKKYHPDNFADNPLADLASEKMKEVNEAYDTITKNRAGGGRTGSTGTGYGASHSSYGTQNYGSGYGSYAGSGTDYSRYAQVRSYIHSGQVDAAESLLNAMTDRDGEWYYLRGEISYRRGWLDEARQYYQTACSMTPGNVEYQRALQTVQGSYTPYRQSSYQRSDLDTACDICNTLLCLNCLCGGCGR
jgi:curved DNA-binding protein CbpA